MDLTGDEGHPTPRVLLGPAITRLLRIRSLYYQLVAVAILGFAGTGSGLFLSLYFHASGVRTPDSVPTYSPSSALRRSWACR